MESAVLTRDSEADTPFTDMLGHLPPLEACEELQVALEGQAVISQHRFCQEAQTLGGDFTEAPWLPTPS